MWAGTYVCVRESPGWLIIPNWWPLRSKCLWRARMGSNVCVCVCLRDSAMCSQAREVCRSAQRECQECQCNSNSLLPLEATTTWAYFIPKVARNVHLCVCVCVCVRQCASALLTCQCIRSHIVYMLTASSASPSSPLNSAASPSKATQ